MNLAVISELARKQMRLERIIEGKALEMKELQKQLRTVAEVDLPEAMEAAGMEDFTLQDGSKVSVKAQYATSITESNRVAAHTWLRSNGFGGLIKHDVRVSFGKEQDADAQRMLEIAAQHNWIAKNKETVHPSTLKAFVKEQIEQGTALPQDLFGVYRVVRATIKVPDQAVS